MNEQPRSECVKVYCPSCQDVYACSPSQRRKWLGISSLSLNIKFDMHVDIDSAYIGPTFPHIFFMTYENLVPSLSCERFEPRVFGFKVHHSSLSLAKPGECRPLSLLLV